MNTPEPIEITESHVTNVAQQLYLAGAAAFFHIDDTGSDAEGGSPSTEEAPAPAETPAESAAPAPAAPAPAAPAKPEKVLEPFAVRYAKYSKGELSNRGVLELLEEAVQDGLADELHELLCFEPQTGAEHFARYYYQAEYHVMCNRPLQALEILAKLDTPGLSDDEKRRVWYKIAVAQRNAHNYEGAGSTLERLVKAFPDRADFARLKKRNHEQFIEEQSMAATTLEKTSSLD